MMQVQSIPLCGTQLSILSFLPYRKYVHARSTQYIVCTTYRVVHTKKYTKWPFDFTVNCTFGERGFCFRKMVKPTKYFQFLPQVKELSLHHCTAGGLHSACRAVGRYENLEGHNLPGLTDLPNLGGRDHIPLAPQLRQPCTQCTLSTQISSAHI